MELELWFSLVALFFTGGLTPGPAVMLVLASSFRYGFKPALLPALGVASANVLWLCVAASGTAALFEIYPRATLALKIIGILVLGWMALSVAVHSPLFTATAHRSHFQCADRSCDDSFRRVCCAFHRITLAKIDGTAIRPANIKG